MKSIGVVESFFLRYILCNLSNFLCNFPFYLGLVVVLLAVHARVMKEIVHVELLAIFLSDFAQIFHVTHRELRYIFRASISMPLIISRLFGLKRTV